MTQKTVHYLPYVTIAMAITVAGWAMGTMIYKSHHPDHSYDAADLDRDSKTCEAYGLKVKPYVNHTRSGDTWIQGADCEGAHGETIPVPHQEDSK